MYDFRLAQLLQFVVKFSFVMFTFTLQFNKPNVLSSEIPPEIDHQIGAVFNPSCEVFIEGDVAGGPDLRVALGEVQKKSSTLNIVFQILDYILFLL